MMFTKATFLVSLFAVAQLAVATPPACLLGAVNSQNDPSNIKAVCSQKSMMNTISSACGSQTKVAMAAYAEVCKSAGVDVSTSTTKSHTSTTKHGGSKPTGMHTTTKTSGGSKPTGSGGSKPTGSGGSKPTSTGGSKPTGNGDSDDNDSTPTPTNPGSGPSDSPNGSTTRPAAGAQTTPPDNAGGRLEAGAMLAVLAAGLVAAF